MTIIFKYPLHLANQSQTLYGVSLGEGMKVYINGHMTKMAAMAVNSKNL